jgi:hypothetical protein
LIQKVFYGKQENIPMVLADMDWAIPAFTGCYTGTGQAIDLACYWHDYSAYSTK